MKKRNSGALSRVLLVVLPFLSVAHDAVAQDRLRSMPGHAQFERMAARIPGSVTQGTLQGVAWVDGGRALEYTQSGARYRFDVATRRAVTIEVPPPAATRTLGRGVERGRQFESALSPDSTVLAFYRDRNLWLSNADGSDERAITTDGSLEKRTKYGTGSWVYGEELNQNTAIWWSPDGRRVAYYYFDESGVTDYYLQLDQTKVQSTVDVEAYPKAGTQNPMVEIYVYDLASGQTTMLDIRNGQPLSDDVVGHYAYRVGWTPDGSEITLNRTNRRQNVMEFTACSPGTGKCRVVVREEWPTGWVMNSPPMQYLEDGRRFLWVSERTGFRNIYLYDLSGRLLSTVTQHPFEVGGIVRVDERAGMIWYMARSGDNYLKQQLHRVGLDGRGDRRLTDPSLHHTVNIAPDGRHFIATSQTHNTPPVTRLHDAQGRMLAELATSDMVKFHELGLKPVELHSYTTGDGVSEAFLMVHKPSDFDPARKYPVLFSVYGGPATNGARETFTLPNSLTEYGFIIVTLDGRFSGGRGKRALDALYEKLGVVEIDDMAAAARALAERPYIDAGRVGIYGTSYGGYAAIMALLRHPQLFHAGSASSPVTDWRHYDTIYTERYMWTPQGNTKGYDEGSAMPYVNDLRGRLMIYYGTADNNVHPSNAMQLIAELQRAGRSFDVMVGPDRGHTGINTQRMMEFFIENLVLANSAATVLQ
ncbi:S9 family peptidase [soil metagenome]